jgi:hypothetical protein
MIILSTPCANAPRLTTAGQKMWSCPTGIEPIIRTPSACSGCPRKDSHGIAEELLAVVPFGQAGGRYGLVPVEERPDMVRLQRVQAALALHDYTQNGPIGDAVMYNADEAGDNASQSWTMEIMATGSGWIDIKGENPKQLAAGASRKNPDWPLPDPETGTTARLVWITARGIMIPCGASVEFLRPSVLHGKAKPLATRIGPPESNAENGVTFRLYFDDGFNSTNAMQPYDAGMPPADGRYWCKVRIEFLRPPAWKDFQAPAETQFALRRQAVAGASVHFLKDSEDNDCRILFPSMATDPAAAVRITTNNGLPIPDVEARLLTEKITGGYRTSIDLSGLPFSTAEIRFWAEATETDTKRMPFQGQCSKSRRDLSGSYIHAGGPQHCGNTASSGFQAGRYHQRCWLPGRCDGFTLADESEGTIGDASFLASLWNRAGWIIEQGMPGSADPRNFKLVLKGGPSPAGFTGSYSDSVPGGYFARRSEFWGNPLGKRITWTDGDGHQHQALVHGLGWMAPYDHSDTDGPVYQPNAATREFALGPVAELVSGWTAGKDTRLRGDPWRYSAATHVYEYTAGGGSLTTVNTPSLSEAYLSAVDPAVVGDAAEVERLRLIYGSE